MIIECVGIHHKALTNFLPHRQVLVIRHAQETNPYARVNLHEKLCPQIGKSC